MPRKSTEDRSGILRFASPAVGEAVEVWAAAKEHCKNRKVMRAEMVSKLRRSSVGIQMRRGESARPAFRPARRVSINSSRGFNSRVEGACKFIAWTVGDVAVPEPALPLEWCSEAWPRLPFLRTMRTKHPGWDHFLLSPASRTGRQSEANPLFIAWEKKWGQTDAMRSVKFVLSDGLRK